MTRPPSTSIGNTTTFLSIPSTIAVVKKKEHELNRFSASTPQSVDVISITGSRFRRTDSTWHGTIATSFNVGVPLFSSEAYPVIKTRNR